MRTRWQDDGSVEPGRSNAAVLERVRALLAKAESTGFHDEAEALTAKAQELMTRHAIDAVLLAAGDRRGDGPEVRTLVLDAPYARERFVLLGAVARANRCRSVWMPQTREATLVGFAADLGAVELLFTSLALQATSAMVAAGTSGATRSRRFRASFLLAFASRIGARLDEAASRATRSAAVDHGRALVPVLASRRDAVDRRTEETFPSTRNMRVVVRDRDGAVAGERAADRADLGRTRFRPARRSLPGR